MPQKPWQVLHVLSNHEKRVEQHLAMRSVEGYVPFYKERVKWTDRTVTTERPLFAGYVFARYDPGLKVAVLSTPGVVRSLGDEEGSLVSDAELDRIRQGLASGYLLRPHRGVSVGTQVRIRHGLFEGVEGVVTKFRQQCNVIIALAAVQQSFSLEVDLAEIEVVNKPLTKTRVTPRSQSSYDRR